MEKLIKRRKPREWLILGLALSVTAIHAALLLPEENRTSYAKELLIHGVGRVLTIYLMILAWRLRNSALPKAIALSVASMLLLMCSDYFYGEHILQAILLLMEPICLIWASRLLQRKSLGYWTASVLAAAAYLTLALILSLAVSETAAIYFRDLLPVFPLLLAGAGIVTLLYRKRFDSEGHRRSVLLRWWTVCLALNGYGLKETLTDTAWYLFFMSGLPFFYAALLRFLKRKVQRPALSGWLYFLCCMVLFRLNLSNPHYGPFREIFFSLLPLIVYIGEQREEGNGMWSHALCAGHLLLGGGFTFLVNERLRMVFYDLGGPAVMIPAGPRANWLAYRLAGLRSFFAGSVQPYEELLGYPGQGDYYRYIMSDDIGAVAFRHGWWWLALMVLLIVTVSALLLKTRRSNPELNCCKNDFAFAILLRSAINILGALLMIPVSGIGLPFEIYPLMDILWLWLLFDRNAVCQAGFPSKKG